jgi:hypothetical protein
MLAGCPRSLAFGDLGSHEPQQTPSYPTFLSPRSLSSRSARNTFSSDW